MGLCACAGNLYWCVANGLYDLSQQSYGDSLVKVSPDTLSVLDSWTPEDQSTLSADDKGAQMHSFRQVRSLLLSTPAHAALSPPVLYLVMTRVLECVVLYYPGPAVSMHWGHRGIRAHEMYCATCSSFSRRAQILVSAARSGLRATTESTLW